MQIILDSTHAEHISLEIKGKIFRFEHTKKDSGATIIRKLTKLKISIDDELKVVVGPGNFTAVRTVCLIGNAIKFLTHCRLFARKKTDSSFHAVEDLQPFYATEPLITISIPPKRDFILSQKLKNSKK